MRSIVLAIAVAATVLGVTACADDGGGSTAQSSSHAGPTAGGIAADHPAQHDPIAIGEPAPGSSPATTKPGPPAAEPGSPAAEPESPGTVAPAPTTTLPSRDDATVDARDYQQGDKFYFQSPTGNILCGFINDNNFGTGCQLAQASVVPPQLSDCGTRPEREVAAQITGGKASFLCLSQGVFVGQPADGGTKGGGKVLGYGQTIIVRGTACTSSATGIRCDAAGHGFTIAGDAQSLF